MTTVKEKIADSVTQQASVSIRVGGQVQGVGYRPFVYRLATKLGLHGWVRNEGATVAIQICGDAHNIERFVDKLINATPQIAQPRLLQRVESNAHVANGFEIKSSTSTTQHDIHLPVDYFLCDDCGRELNDPHNRRYQYPFINCTQCGPRYTIIKSLPYDRHNTTMADFRLCSACEKEYRDPMDRRFHAEPIACPQCGPQLSYQDASQTFTDTAAAFSACLAALRAGEIVAIKGIGGYHLCCDALNQQAIQTLRDRKQRPDKPLAVMFAEQGQDGLDMVRDYLQLDDVSSQQLLTPARPIVLLTPIANRLPANLAPQLNEVGAMLAYSPLHHLLLQQFVRPIVATSANFSGEPVLTDNHEVVTRLKSISQKFLHHNRPIQRPADDTVLRIINNKARPLRLGRGMAPLELPLRQKLLHPVLACGGQMKNTVALAFEDRVVISPHIGDLDSPRSEKVFAQVIADLQDIYQVNITQLVCDAHPGYRSNRWARQQAMPVHEVFHHHAHAAVLAGEYPDVDRWLVFTWDGVGYGEDGSLWGGEGLYGRPGNWQRATSWRPFHLPAGDKAARQPWRSALALCWETSEAFANHSEDVALLHQAWQQRINTAKSSAVGRLFDAAAALSGICEQASFEGQAPMWLESAANTGRAETVGLPLARDAQGLWLSDWQPLIAFMQDTTRAIEDRACSFHHSLARALVDQACAVRDERGDFVVGLCGGVFQNKLLTQTVYRELSVNDFRVAIPDKVPLNDGGLCYGQIIEFAASRDAHV